MRGETVLVVDRDVPVARIEPIDRSVLAGADAAQMLVRQGIAIAPRPRLDAEAFLRRKKATTIKGASAVDALLREREEGR